MERSDFFPSWHLGDGWLGAKEVTSGGRLRRMSVQFSEEKELDSSEW